MSNIHQCPIKWVWGQKEVPHDRFGSQIIADTTVRISYTSLGKFKLQYKNGCWHFSIDDLPIPIHFETLTKARNYALKLYNKGLIMKNILTTDWIIYEG